MLTFFQDFIGLFNDTFSAVCTVDYFMLLLGYILLMVGYGMFCHLKRGASKL